MTVEEAFYFLNRDKRRLFGVAHRPDSPKGRLVGVVFCHPLGEEKQFSYRPFVRFARFLAERGVSSLRFDCCGFGDSEGDLSEATIQTQINDTRDAIDYVSDNLGVDRVVLFGVRLGATVAALVGECDPRPSGLALISPLIDGVGYWDQLVETRRMAVLTMGEKPQTTDELWDELDRTGIFEIGAQFVNVEFASQIKAVDLIRDTGRFEGSVFLGALLNDHAGAQATRRLLESYQPKSSCTFFPEQDRDFWSQRCMYDRYVPQVLFDRIAGWISTCP